MINYSNLHSNLPFAGYQSPYVNHCIQDDHRENSQSWQHCGYYPGYSGGVHKNNHVGVTVGGVVATVDEGNCC